MALEKRVMLDASLGALTTTTVMAENDANATPQILDSDVTISGTTTDFDGDALTISTTGGAEDQLTLNDEGTGAGQIGFDGANVTFEGVLIATVSSNGTNGLDLVFDLNINASKAAIERLIENITYQNSSDSPTLNRTINFSLGAYFSEDISVTVVAQNEAPSVDTNTPLSLLEGSTATITSAMLGVSDPDNTDTEVIFNITSTTINGRIELSTNTGVAITSFSLDDLNNNRVQYVHDDSETISDSFDFTITDGTDTVTAQTFSIDVTPVDEAPIIVTNNGADVSLGFSVSLGGDASTFGIEKYRESGVGSYGTNQGLIDGQSSQFTLIFTTAATNYAANPGQVLFEDGGSGRGIGLYLNSANELVWYSGAASNTPVLSSGAALANSTQYAVVVEVDVQSNEIRMHYRQAGNFDWFSYGRTAEASLTGYTDTADLSGGNDGGIGVVGGGSYGGFNGSANGTTAFQGTIDSDFIVYDFPLDPGELNTKLIATDIDDSSSALIYTITGNVSFGTIYKDGVALGLGDTFTQNDLDVGSITYDSMIGSDDQFIFSLYDGTNTIAGQTYDIRVNTVNTAPVLLEEVTIYDEDFEGGASGWNNNTTSTDATLSQFWGRFGRNVHVAGDQELFQTFALSGDQEYITIEFDFYELDSWENERFYLFINDTQVLNNDIYNRTTYDREVGGTFGDVTYRVQELTDDIGFITYNTSYQDQIVRYSLTIKNTDSSFKLGFGSNLNTNDLNNEAFGIDNLKIKELKETGSDRVIEMSELTPNNDQIGHVAGYDPDVGQSLTYTITGGTGVGIFSVDSATGEIKIIDNSSIDYELGIRSYTLDVRATDNGPGLLFDDQTYTINILDALENTAPVFTSYGPFSIAENASVNDDVGTVVTTDAEGDTRTYSIVSGNNDNVFKINATTGLIEIANNTLLDYDRDNQYTIRIRAYDDNALSKYTDRNVVINITDIDEAPLLTAEAVVETTYFGVYYSAATGNFCKEITTNRSFDDALSFAETQLLFGQSGHLVTITSAAEQSFVDQMTSTHSWIAASDSGNEGEWYWMAGPEAGMQIVRNGNVDNGAFYNNWNGSEPNSGTGANYALMNNNDLWYDDNNGSSRYSVVEWEGKDVINNDTYTLSHSNPDGSDINVGDSVGFVKGIDPEGGVLNYSVQAGNGDGIFEIDTLTGELRILDTTNLNATVTDSYILTIRATEAVGGKFAEIDITINFNDDFTITHNNPLNVLEGATTPITIAELNISDIDNVASDTIFRMESKPVNGRIELTTYPGYEISRFTLDDIQNNRVVYIHDGSQTLSDGFDFSVTDGGETVSGNTFNIVITDVNYGPSIITNTGATVLEGGSIGISQAMLDSTDTDVTDTPDQLTYTASSIANGHIEVNGVTSTTFTQDDVNNNRVVFIHDGAEANGSFDFSLADDGEDSAVPATGTFTLTRTPLNDTPIITTNAPVSVVEGQTVTITTAILNTTDPDDSGTGLTYTLSNITNGFVELSTNPGVPILSFTQADLNANRVVFRHDGNEGNAQFDVSVADGGEHGAVPDSATINLTKIAVNDAPTIGLNLGSSVNQNSIVLIKNAVLRAADPDDSGIGLDFNITGTVNGQVEFVSNPNVAITSFTQDDIDNSRIAFRHSGPPTTASFDFTIADGGEHGAGTASGTFSMSVDNINDAPIISTNAAPTMNEGATLVLNTTMLDSFDPDDFGTGLDWTASNLSNGIIQVNGVTQNTFTQADLDAGLVTFIHDDSETTVAGFDIQVADGGENSAAPDTDTFLINVTPINEAPTLVINDGAPNIIDFNDYTIEAFDAFQDGQNGLPATATVSADGSELTIGGNAWKRVLYPYSLTANTVLSFEFQTDDPAEIVGIGFDDASGFGGGVLGYQLYGSQVWSGMDQTFRTYQSGDGWVRFDIPIGQDYTGNMTQMVFVLDHDASGTSSITFRNVNFYESGNEVRMNEGGALNLTNVHINTVDVDDSGTGLTYTASNIENGHLEVNGVMATTFTQDDIDNNRLTFIHDGGDTLTAGFDLSVIDGTENGTLPDTGRFDIIIDAVDDLPTAAINNGVTLNEGATVTISNAQLTTTDIDTEPRKVIFDVTASPANGRLERSTAPGVAITAFSLADINAGRVRFVHDGSETTTDSFTFTVRDETNTLAADTFNIVITPQNDGAVITGDLSMTVIEGNSVTITTADLSAIDPDDGAGDVTYTVSALSNGIIKVGGVTQNTFTRQNIIDNDVTFTHDGSETVTAGFNISLADGLEHGAVADTDVMSITVTPVDDLPAVATNNGITLNEGATIDITTAALTTSDVDTLPAAVIFDVTGALSNGRLQLSTNAGVAITSFSLADIQAGRVQYVHNGSETTTDSFDFTVRDATNTLAADTFNITVTPQNDSAVIGGDLTIAMNEGASYTLTTTDLSGIDPDDINADITFTASNISNGTIEVGGVAQNTFTYQDIINSDVAFIHDGSETLTAGFDVSLADGLEHGAIADTASIAITVTPQNDAPTAIDLSNLDILETSEIGTIIGALSTTDSDLPADSFTYSIIADPDSKFILDSGNLVLNAALDFESQATHSVTVRSDDGNGGTFDQIFTINVTDNVAPDVIELDNMNIDENSEEQTLVGNLAATDANMPNDVMSYTLMTNPDNMFMISGDQLLLQSNALDFEEFSSIDIVVRVTDVEGNTFDQTFTIDINDIAEFSNEGFIEPERTRRHADLEFLSLKEPVRDSNLLLSDITGNFGQRDLFEIKTDQILRNHTTDRIREILGLDLSIPFIAQNNDEVVQKQVVSFENVDNSGGYTNMREAMDFLQDISDIQDISDEADILRQYDVNSAFVDVLTYHENRQAKLRQALMD